jgi:hypothetical protein
MGEEKEKRLKVKSRSGLVDELWIGWMGWMVGQRIEGCGWAVVVCFGGRYENISNHPRRCRDNTALKIVGQANMRGVLVANLRHVQGPTRPN